MKWPRPCPEPPRTPAVEPLTADLRRLHLTVSKGFLEKVAAARTGLSHALPGATAEQVLEAALDLLLEKQARAKALVKRPRRAPPAEAAPWRRPHRPATGDAAPTSPPPSSARSASATATAASIRSTRGGVCGSTWRVELDHVVPLALGGETTAANLRCLCWAHHRQESERVLGGRERGSAEPRGR